MRLTYKRLSRPRLEYLEDRLCPSVTIDTAASYPIPIANVHKGDVILFKVNHQSPDPGEPREGEPVVIQGSGGEVQSTDVYHQDAYISITASQDGETFGAYISGFDSDESATVDFAHINITPGKDKFHILASPSPHLEDIAAQARVDGFGAGATPGFDWTAKIKFVPADDDNAPANTAEEASMQKHSSGDAVTFTQQDVGRLLGGRLSFVATTQVAGFTLTSYLSTNDQGDNLMVVGDNPDAAAVMSFVQSLGTPAQALGAQRDFSRVVEAIIKHESGGNQSLTEQFLDGLPQFNTTGDGGVGLMQITFHRTRHDLWDWQQNIRDGFNLLAGNLRQADQHFRNERIAIAPQLPVLAAKYHVHSVTVQVPTADDLILDAISLFGPNSRYYHKYNRNGNQYVVTVHGDAGTIDLVVVPNGYVDTILSLY